MVKTKYSKNTYSSNTQNQSQLNTQNQSQPQTDGIGRIVKSILIGIVIYLILNIFIPLINFKPYFDWWRTFNDIDGKHCIDLVALAYWQYFPLYYYVRVLTTSETSRFQSPAWAYFISGILNGGAKGIVPGGQVTPRNICQTLVPKDKPHEIYSGVKEWPTNIDDWKEVFKKWGDIQISGRTYMCDTKKWVENQDNFLWNISEIPGDSPLVKAFVTGWDSDDSGRLYPGMMLPLLGITSGSLESGGWWGFLQNSDNFQGFGLSEIQRIVWADSRPDQRKEKKSCNPYSAISAGLSMGIAGFFLNPVAGIVAGLAGAGLQAAGDGCF